MKRIIILSLLIAMIFSLTGCFLFPDVEEENGKPEQNFDIPDTDEEYSYTLTNNTTDEIGISGLKDTRKYLMPGESLQIIREPQRIDFMYTPPYQGGWQNATIWIYQPQTFGRITEDGVITR